MTDSIVVVEPTQAFRDWARTQSIASSLTTDGAGRVTFYAGGLPKSPTFPAVVMTRVGGGIDGPLDLGLYQFDCWASTLSAAAALAGSLVSWLESIGPQSIGGGVTVCGASTNSVNADVDLDDPDAHRYAVTAQVVTKRKTP